MPLSSFNLPSLDHLPVEAQVPILEQRTCDQRRQIRKMSWFILALLVLLAGAWAYALFTGYYGRVDLVDSQRNGCIRGKADRQANADSWNIQANADEAVSQDPDQPKATRVARAQAARQHRVTADDLRERATINCSEAYPSPSLTPFGG